MTEEPEHVERWSETPDPFLKTARDPETTVALRLEYRRS